jgi:ribosome-binding factor A
MLLHEIADVVRGLTDPRLGFVTITGVETSPDLHTAHVYYSVLGSSEEREECSQALKAATGHVRGEVGHRIRLKYTPAIVFTPDHGIEEGAKISNLLREIKDDES